MKTSHKRGLPLDARQLNAFVTLVETGSFTETARRLSLTQSAVSHSMRALEEETGCRLLDKAGNSIVPTEAGEALLHHARLGLREFARGREAVEQFKTWGARRLRVGAPASINQRFLPFILVDLRRQHPRLMLTVKTIAPALEPERILHGELDFVLCEAPPANPNLDFTPLFQSPLQIIVPSAHRWLAGQPIPPDELCREPFLLPERQSSSRGLIERHCAREKISLNVVAEAQDFETLKELVKAGYGVGLLPAWLVREEIAAGALRALPLPGRELKQTWGLVRGRHRPMDTVECAFQRACVKSAKKFPT
jgi:DNA-binding transcriptional LysR family regulator